MTQTIARLLLKIGDILSEAEDYNEALTCNEELQEMYNKIDDMLFNLGREDPGIIFYRKNNKLDSILKCYDSLINKAAKPIKYDLYGPRKRTLLSKTTGNRCCRIIF
ncbi:MAG TPA: hypothetical protein LFW11_05735 [Rickettsia endosymbiont of Proechinophthirus fluctus]|uniref:hypothetical protein n=1 Tax=Rickettsia endosymbiont of Proechinophthirus fluctus TaxID=1462733 RepID=UPI000AEB6B80|nr:hypothetical protein [Rickettsia endosymbiont of Proechinophthirus fluctus]HJD54815.1 hypothetical protein [Rickettsia endosymbiont of Proechinophthirus fluctus]